MRVRDDSGEVLELREGGEWGDESGLRMTGLGMERMGMGW